MKRKIPFLYPALLMISTLCFFVMACFSGYQEKGEVTISFSESTINKILSRGAGISEEQDEGFNLSDILSGYEEILGSEENQKMMALYELFANEPIYMWPATTKSNFSSPFDMTHVLLIYESGDYLLVSNKASEIMSVGDPDNFQEMLSLMSLNNGMFVSKGTWDESDKTIYISEDGYFDSTTGSWVEMSGPQEIGIIYPDSESFTVKSKSNVSYLISKNDKYLSSDWIDSNDNKTDSGDKTHNQKLVVQLTVGNRLYEKTYPLDSGMKMASITFSNLNVGLTSKVSAIFYEFTGGTWQILAKGESENFTITPGVNKASIKMKKNGSEFPSGTIVDCYFGKEIDTSDFYDSYLLALYETRYAIYKFPYEFMENHKEYAFSSESDKTEVLKNASAMLEYGSLVSFGTYTSSINSDKQLEFDYIEQKYYDSDSKTFKNSSYTGNNKRDFDFGYMIVGTMAGIEIEFSPFADDSQYTDNLFTFMISGYEENDFLDLGTNECNVYLYQIKDSSVMQTIKAAINNEKITDAQKAEDLIPIIENKFNSSLTSFQPGVSNDDISGFTNKVHNDGTIYWSGECISSVAEGETYGVLATVYFGLPDNNGFYEFGIGYTDNLTYSSTSNVISINIENMNIPCNIYFDCGNSLDSDYTVRTALTNIVVVKNGEINGSVMNEIFSASQTSIRALEDQGYKYDENSIPFYSFQDGVPFVTLYYTYDDATGGIQEGDSEP